MALVWTFVACLIFFIIGTFVGGQFPPGYEEQKMNVKNLQALQTELNLAREQLRGCRRFVEPR